MNDAPKHPVSPDPANELASDHSPIDPRDFRNALGTYGTGVTIITTVAADGKPYGLTCNSFASVSLNPPLVLWSLGTFSSSLSVFQNADFFAVNILGRSQQALADKFAKSSEEKFVGVEWTPGLGNAPLLAGCVANFQCRAANRYYGGDHVIFLGAVEAYSYNQSEPLLFARGGYGQFAAGGPAAAASKSSTEKL
jgi:flavin reductase (DIM6/NTAB) family NADH-FMN oxidoreductase RutF